jgi:hypothetical protein
VPVLTWIKARKAVLCVYLADSPAAVAIASRLIPLHAITDIISGKWGKNEISQYFTLPRSLIEVQFGPSRGLAVKAHT